MRFGDGRDWFFEKRFGLFVHWGRALYQLRGDPRHMVGHERARPPGPFRKPDDPLSARVEVTPSIWRERAYLRLRGLPVNEYAGEVMVAKLEFGQLPV